MPNWESVYPERINWENSPSHASEIDEKNLNKGDSAVYEMDKRILALGKSIDFILEASRWQGTYSPYTYTIDTDFFEDDDHPIAQVWGINTPETSDEINQRNYITKIICTSTNVIVYAGNGKPTVDLKLIMRR